MSWTATLLIQSSSSTRAIPFTFGLIPLREKRNSFTHNQLWVLIVSLLSFNKCDLGIKKPTMVNIPLNKEIETKLSSVDCLSTLVCAFSNHSLYSWVFYIPSSSSCRAANMNFSDYLSIYLSISWESSLSSIAFGRSSRLHPVSIQTSCR